MKIYHYSKQTREFIGESEARLDPLAGKPMIPASATPYAPPGEAGEGMVWVFDPGAEEWSEIVDNRGAEYFLPNGRKEVIGCLGAEMPTDAVLVPPPASMACPKWNGGEWIDETVERQQVLLDKLAGLNTVAELKAFIAEQIIGGEAKAATPGEGNGKGDEPGEGAGAGMAV